MLPAFRWLGVAGIELFGGRNLLSIDPFFTRPPFWRIWIGRVPSDGKVIARYIQPYRLILITHSHYDHLMDVPEIARMTGADVYGSQNTCRLLLALGVPPGQVHQIKIGDHITREEYAIEVFPSQHPRLPIDRIINGPLPQKLVPPLHLFDYRMDTPFSYRIQVSGLTALHGDYPIPADILFSSPLRPGKGTDQLIPLVSPRLIVPIHWDNFFRPLTQPIRPLLQPPTLSAPVLRSIDLNSFQRVIEDKYPGIHVIIPEIFKTYSLREILP